MVSRDPSSRLLSFHLNFGGGLQSGDRWDFRIISFRGGKRAVGVARANFIKQISLEDTAGVLSLIRVIARG